MLNEQLSLLFYWFAVGAYICSFIFYAAKIKLPSRVYLRWATIFLVSGLVFEITTIIFRYMAAGGFSRVSFFEIFLFISAFVVLEALIVELWSKVHILGFYASLLAVVLLLIGWARYAIPKPLVENLKTPWIVIHAGLVFIAYAAFIVAAGAAVFYLLQERQLKLKKSGALQKFLPSLEVLDETVYRSIVSGFIVFTVALVLGVGGATKLWKGIDVSITLSSFITWFVYLFYLLSRLKLGWVGKKASYLAVAGLAPIVFIRLIVVPFLTKFHGYI